MAQLAMEASAKSPRIGFPAFRVALSAAILLFLASSGWSQAKPRRASAALTEGDRLGTLNPDVDARYFIVIIKNISDEREGNILSLDLLRARL